MSFPLCLLASILAVLGVPRGLAFASVETSTAHAQDAAGDERCPVGDDAPQDADDTPTVDDTNAAVVIRVRVVDVRGGEVPGGCYVQLRSGEERYGRRTNDAGEVAFPFAEAPYMPRIEVLPGDGWRWFRRPPYGVLTLDTPYAKGEETLTVEVARTETGVVHGLVLDDATGEPLAGYRFRLSRPPFPKPESGAPMELETDALGRFHTPRAIPGGRWNLRANSGESMPIDLPGGQWDCLVPTEERPDPVVLRVPVGATYDLELEGAVPDDPTSLRAVIVAAHGRDAGPRWEAPLRVTDDRVWVRFAPEAFATDGAAFLAVVGDGGFLAGTASLGVGAPRRDGTVTVTLERTGSYRLHEALVGPDEGHGDDRGHGLRYTVEPLDPALLDETTNWRIGERAHLRPGRYRWTAWSRAHERRTVEFEVVAGETYEPEEPLTKLPEGRVVRGTIEWADESVTYRCCELHVRCSTLPVRDFEIQYDSFGSCVRYTSVHYASSRDADGRVAEFELSSVPDGPLEVFGADHVGRVAVVERSTDEDGALRLRIVMTDPAVGEGFGFSFEPDALAPPYTNWPTVHTRDLATGEVLPTHRTRGGVIDRRPAGSLGREWALTRDGCAPLYFTAAAFVPDASGRAIVPAVFRPGWGARVRVVDEAGTPIAGAAVLVDGVLAATSDAEGWCTLESPVAPLRVVARHGAVERGVAPGGPWTDVVLPRGE